VRRNTLSRWIEFDLQNQRYSEPVKVDDDVFTVHHAPDRNAIEFAARMARKLAERAPEKNS